MLFYITTLPQPSWRSDSIPVQRCHNSLHGMSHRYESMWSNQCESVTGSNPRESNPIHSRSTRSQIPYIKLVLYFGQAIAAVRIFGHVLWHVDFRSYRTSSQQSSSYTAVFRRAIRQSFSTRCSFASYCRLSQCGPHLRFRHLWVSVANFGC